MAKPLIDKIAALREKKEKLAAQLNDLTAKAKQADRKLDARRKIVVGGAILAAIDSDTDLAAMVRLVLDRSVTRPADREAVADLLQEKAKAAAGAKTGQPARAA